MPQPILFRLIDRAVFEYKMIEPGDRILAGASGGKDSTALIEYFANRKRRPSADFEFTALNIQADFAPPFPDNIARLFRQWNVDFKSIDVNVLGRLKQGRKMSCYWCSTQRRTELLNYAVKNGYNKIALGHHMDDILETLIMNVLDKGRMSAMPPHLQYKNYPVAIIRPLCCSAEDIIIEHAQNGGYIGWTCTCSYQNNSARKEARRRLTLLTDGDRAKKERLFQALKNPEEEYLP